MWTLPIVPGSVCAIGGIAASPVECALGLWPGMVGEARLVLLFSLCHMLHGARMRGRHAMPLMRVHIGVYMFWHRTRDDHLIECG